MHFWDVFVFEFRCKEGRQFLTFEKLLISVELSIDIAVEEMEPVVWKKDQNQGESIACFDFRLPIMFPGVLLKEQVPRHFVDENAFSGSSLSTETLIDET